MKEREREREREKERKILLISIILVWKSTNPEVGMDIWPCPAGSLRKAIFTKLSWASRAYKVEIRTPSNGL